MTCRLSHRGVAVAFLTLPLFSFTAVAELAVSANDGKAVQELVKTKATPLRWMVLGLCDG